MLGFEGTCSVHIDRRKNDTECKGHYAGAIGRSLDPSLDIVTQMRGWMRITGLHVRKDCPKREQPAARCSCPPLFPNTHCAKGGVTVVTDRSASRQQASVWIRWAVTQAGSKSQRFSGISARKGDRAVIIDPHSLSAKSVRPAAIRYIPPRLVGYNAQQGR